jgi:hypothetical protein
VDEVDITISVPPTAPAGEHTINLTATPTSGENPVRSSFKIEVEAAENGAAAPAGTQPADLPPPRGTQPTPQ